MATRKTGKKTGKGTMRSPRSGAVVPTGAHPGNTGGKKGRSGRKPKAFIDLCNEAIAAPEFQQTLVDAITNPSDQHHRFYVQTAIEYTQPKPKQEHEHTGRVTLEHLLSASADR